MSGGTLSPEAVQAILDASPFIAFSGLKVVSADLARGEITMRCPMRPEFERRAGSGQWHGGPIAAVIDTVGDFALGMLVGRGLPTVNFRVDYLRPALHTDLVATATVRRNGRSIGVADVDVFNEQGVLLAIGRASYAMTEPGK
ncbi:PaaI family thioesterase [Rhodovastum atsumiense]|uniref:PaaI family thioesterase n=1 Tax=Rhodovastum atsumiense TaxID=504468 RepID=A0A5M6IS01_9PROT|nr:PaaI family thioesterase [Rhodovastum atsumiense]KAA5610667.1 PaaI family thioesterase [Rhodovastum atsumiense]CAH2603339.1 PaaI family thioesterase [Rhodovastum atsumiense]